MSQTWEPPTLQGQNHLVERDGSVTSFLSFDIGQYDTVAIRTIPDDGVIICQGRVDGEIVYSDRFEQRQMSFDPISSLGLGERERVNGLTPQDTQFGDISTDVLLGLLNNGFTPVPRGTDWMNNADG